MLTTAILLVLIVGLMYQVYRLTVRLNDIEEVAEHAHTRTDTQQNKHEYLTGAMDTVQKEIKHLESDVKVHKDALEAAIEILPGHKKKIRELENIVARVILPHIEEWFGKRSDDPIALKTIKLADELRKDYQNHGSFLPVDPSDPLDMRPPRPPVSSSS